jgi:ketosteroid isomerase-like protein
MTTSLELAESFVQSLLVEWRYDMSLFAEGAIGWHNTDDREGRISEGADRLAGLRQLIPDLRGEVRRIDTWDDGFAIRYVLVGTAVTAASVYAPAAIFGTITDGLITRVEEYVDSAAFAQLVVGPTPTLDR